MMNFIESSGLYTAVELARMGLLPMRTFIQAAEYASHSQLNPYRDTVLGKSVAASWELAERLTRHYPKPEFGITTCTVNGQKVTVQQETVMVKPFCHLLHFKKEKGPAQPTLLIVAPLSGHYATLLRGTVQDTLPFFDVYITDWVNASEVPISEGSFDLDDYINYIIEFTSFLPRPLHIMAVCQPTIPVIAATAIMSKMNHPDTPRTVVLMGGPIDNRLSPTEIDNFAERREMNWFESNLITRVPMNYPGFMRPVYPGFIQLTGFMAMNMQRHVGAHVKLFSDLVQGDGESADYHRKFYDEYLAVLDMPAEFYLQTIKTVFKTHDLPKGTMVSRGRPVKLEEIRNTRLLVIEGEKDDISGVGSTKAALKLCKNIPEKDKHYYLQPEVGHYGVFSGRRFREQIVPVIVDFIQKDHK